MAGYGAEVTGLADPVVRALRSMATQHFGIRGRHSQTAALLLHGDPVLPLATAAARRWAQEVWRADFSVSALSRSRLVHYFKSFKVCRRWQDVRGPLSAAWLERQIIGPREARSWLQELENEALEKCAKER